MARVSIKSICSELMADFKTMAFIQKRLFKKLDKEVDDAAIRAQANRLVREGEIDHARAAKKYNIRGPKAGTVAPTTTKRRAKEEEEEESLVKAKRRSKASKEESPAKSSKKKSEKVSKVSSKKSSKKEGNVKSVKLRRRSKR